MNAAMRLLFRGGAWLKQAEAATIARHGLLHLRAYKMCARLSLSQRQPRFPIHGKNHMLIHTFRFLQLWSKDLDWIESPLCDSTQMDESFIGIVSRLSRRVSPKATIQRTYDLYMTLLKQRLDTKT